jgi:hypothetical protein
MARLREDPVIDALHLEAVKLHIAKRDALLAREEYREMQEQLRNASTLPPQEEKMLIELGLAS